MKNFLTVWKDKREVERNQDLKNRILKNKEAVLDVMSSKIEGARQCPLLLGQKCIGQLCEHFMEFRQIDVNNKSINYWRCTHVQLPLLLIELNVNVLKLISIHENKEIQTKGETNG